MTTAPELCIFFGGLRVQVIIRPFTHIEHFVQIFIVLDNYFKVSEGLISILLEQKSFTFQLPKNSPGSFAQESFLFWIGITEATSRIGPLNLRC
jgi:hypothetical protein